MRQITLCELQDIMRKSAGEDEYAEQLEQVADQPFEQLGYDSLALLETQARIRRDCGVGLSEDDLDQVNTPQQLLDVVNALMKEA
jgi:act minimal PKS acyl carrier protein